MPRLLLILCVFAVALSGCVSISEESARQLDEVGDVELTTVICASRANAGADCPASNHTELNEGGQYQVLIGYRLPAQSSAPESIAAAEVPLTLSRSASYSAELARLAPPGEGRQWVGYVSPPFAYQALQSEQSATIVTRVLLLRGADGAPFQSPFRHRTIAGFRRIASDDDPNRPIACGERLGETNADEKTSCMTSPVTAEAAETDVEVQTRDLGVLAAAPASVPRGGGGSVDFTVAYSGKDAAPAFAVAASTTIPGGTAAPAITSVAPAAAGNTPLPVAVSAPASTDPGTYEVALTASLPNGQTRRATTLVAVTGSDPVDRTPPEVAARMKSRPRIKRALRVGMVADVSCSEACVVGAELRVSRKIARRLRVAPAPGLRVAIVGTIVEKSHAAGRRNVRIRFNRGLGPRLKRMRRVKLSLRVTAIDRFGNVRRRTVGFSLRR